MRKLFDIIEKTARASKREAGSVQYLREMLEMLKVMLLNSTATNQGRYVEFGQHPSPFEAEAKLRVADVH